MVPLPQACRSRRAFLRHAAMVSTCAAGLPYFVPASVLGGEGSVPPSERIIMGGIGAGGMGKGNLNRFMSFPDVRVVAVCDVDAEHRKQAKALVDGRYKNNDCAAYNDFRELLDRKDLNAVSIATPDHWHGLISIAAAKAGKDIYCEKPLVNSVGEGRAVCKAVQENKVILQTGSQERSGANARFAAELVRNGRLGKLHTIRINLPCGEGHHKQAMALTTIPPEEPIPPGFDYDFWLGHTPKVPYTSKRCHFWWRFILAYGGGEMTDRGAHVIDLAQLIHGTDDTGPIRFKASGKRNVASLYDAFWEYEFENVFADGVRMIGQSSGPRGAKFEGDKGTLFIAVHGGRLTAEPPSLLQEQIGPNEIQVGRSPGHHRNFIDCVKSRQQPVAPAEVGHRTATICHLNNIAMIVGRSFNWDPLKEISDDDEVNKLLTPVMRPPWKL